MESKLSFAKRVAGVVVGTAVGDALGYQVEFTPLEERLRLFPGGVDGYRIRLRKGEALYSDDTQMMRAVAEGLLRAGTWTDIGMAAREVAEEFVAWMDSSENNRAPGGACMRGCRALKNGEDWRTAGGAKAGGSGAPMRSMAYGIWFAQTSLSAGTWAAQHARMTHGHPGAQEAAYLMAAFTSCLLRGFTGEDLFEVVTAHAGKYDQATLAMVKEAWNRAKHTDEPTEKILADYPGWSAHHAMAAALVCYARSGGNFREGMRLAATWGGDADTVACMTGALLGAQLGIDGIPAEWVAPIEKREQLLTLAGRLAKAVEGKTDAHRVGVQSAQR